MDIITKEEILSALNYNIIIKEHSFNRMRELSITTPQIIDAINNDDIIERYPDDIPYLSVLILGNDRLDNPIHIVCSPCKDGLNIITVYYPSAQIWEPGMKERRTE